MTITTGSHPKALWPGVKVWWGRDYESHEKYWSKMFDMETSNMHYEELVELTGFPLAPVKDEGTATSFSDESQGVVNRATHVAYGLGYICTREEIEDGLYPIVTKRRTSALAFSMAATKNTVGANVYNRGFSGSYTFGDGVSLLSTSHPVKAGGVQSNKLSVAADFSESSLEDLCIQIMQAKNARDLNVPLQPKTLIGPPQLAFEFERVVKSTLQNDTANNAINSLRSMGLIPEVIVNPYLTDPDAWFVRTNAPYGMVGYDRTPIEFSNDGDFSTDNLLHKAYERYSFIVGDWRGLYGSEGA